MVSFNGFVAKVRKKINNDKIYKEFIYLCNKFHNNGKEEAEKTAGTAVPIAR
jgi:hypothetical protein